MKYVASIMQRGSNPKPIRKRIVFAAAIGAALASGILAFCLAPHDERIVEKEKVVERSVYEDDPALNLDRKSLTLPKTARTVKAGLKLDRGDQALLRIVFFAADESPKIKAFNPCWR